MLAGAESLLGILLAGGIAAQDAAWAVDILMLIVTVTATEADIRRAAGHTTDADRDDAVAQIRDTFAGLSAARFPLSTPSSMASLPAPPQPDARHHPLGWHRNRTEAKWGALNGEGTLGALTTSTPSPLAQADSRAKALTGGGTCPSPLTPIIFC